MTAKKTEDKGWTIRPFSRKAVLFIAGLTLLIALCLISLISYPIHDLPSLVNLVLLAPSTLVLLYVLMGQISSFIRVTPDSLTALHSWANGVDKVSNDRFALPRLRTIPFDRISEAARTSVPWGDRFVAALAITTRDRSLHVLHVGAYREKDLVHLMKWLHEHGVATSTHKP